MQVAYPESLAFMRVPTVLQGRLFNKVAHQLREVDADSPTALKAEDGSINGDLQCYAPESSSVFV